MGELCQGFTDLERFVFAFFGMRYPAALLRVCLAGLALHLILSHRFRCEMWQDMLLGHSFNE